MRTKQQLSFVPPTPCRAFESADFTRGVLPIQPWRSFVRAMTDQDRTLVRLVRAHAPAATSSGLASDLLDADLELRSELGFDLMALAELAVAIEDAFGIAIEMTGLDGCRTIRDLQELVTTLSP
jgi:acyl carrier protein